MQAFFIEKLAPLSVLRCPSILQKLCIIGFFILSFHLLPAKALDIFGQGLPQSQNNTCQSYSMMLSLAAKGDPKFNIANFQQLRAAEARFRSLAEGKPGGPYGHGALKAALEDFTNGKYTLEILEFSDIVSWMQKLGSLTALKSTNDELIAGLTGKSFPAVLTSVKQYGGVSYAPGSHIISAIGMIGNGFNSSTQLVAFNGAIKGQGSTVNQCAPGNQPGDEKYRAGVVYSNQLELTSFGGKYRLLNIKLK